MVLSVLLRYTDSDYPFGIFKIFPFSEIMWSCKCDKAWVNNSKLGIYVFISIVVLLLLNSTCLFQYAIVCVFFAKFVTIDV